MKKLPFILLIALVGMLALSCKKENPAPALVQLTEQEKSDLLFLREEEKLAHDVYVYAFDLYGLQIFSNISGSESRHISSVADLLSKYGITDPAANLEEGAFTIPELQELYTNLIAKVDISQTDALEVGATIEDLDINDIKQLFLHTTKSDLISVYDNLTCGSRNHLRAFVSQLGGQYTPQYLSETEFDAIINSPHESCGNK